MATNRNPGLMRSGVLFLASLHPNGVDPKLLRQTVVAVIHIGFVEYGVRVIKEVIVARLAGDIVASSAAVHIVVAQAAEHDVVVLPAADQVIAVAAKQTVVSAVPPEG